MQNKINSHPTHVSLIIIKPKKMLDRYISRRGSFSIFVTVHKKVYRQTLQKEPSDKGKVSV